MHHKHGGKELGEGDDTKNWVQSVHQVKTMTFMGMQISQWVGSILINWGGAHAEKLLTIRGALALIPLYRRKNQNMNSDNQIVQCVGGSRCARSQMLVGATLSSFPLSSSLQNHKTSEKRCVAETLVGELRGSMKVFRVPANSKSSSNVYCDPLAIKDQSFSWSETIIASISCDSTMVSNQ